MDLLRMTDPRPSISLEYIGFRKFFRALLPIAFSAALLAFAPPGHGAAFPFSRNEAARNDGQATPTKVVTAALGSGFTTLDPYNATDKISRVVMKSFYEGFLRLNDRLEPEPSLALSAEPSEDGLSWVIKLREGVRFSNGEAFDAHAAKLNLDHLIHEKTRLGRSKMFGPIIAAEATGEYEITLRLSEPFGFLRRRLAGGILSMVCPAALSDPNWNLSNTPCGTGPYALKSYNPSELLEVVRRSDYWDGDLPHLAGIRFVPVVENHARAAMLKTGEADFAMPLPYESAPEIERTPGLVVSRKPSTVMRFVAMNNLRAPYSDIRVREAINCAINREALVKAAYRGYARPASGVIPPAIPGAMLLGSWPYDPNKARALLAEAGFPDGFEANLWCAYQDSASQRAVQLIQQQLAAVGIRVKITILEAGERVARVHKAPPPGQVPALELYYTGWSASSDADWSLRPLYHSKSAPPVLFNTAYYTNESVDSLMDQAFGIADETEARAEQAKIQETIRKDAPYAWCIFEDSVAAWRSELRGFTNQADGGIDFIGATWDRQE